jgi:hypothetical protein
MIKFNELKIGDYVITDYEGNLLEGEVTRLNGDEKQIEVETSVQAFWYDEEHVHPIPLSDEQLTKLSFTKQVNDDGSTKYMKGSFRIVLPHSGDFSKMEMWYREDKRHNPDVHFVHQLQNHYLDMVKIHLTRNPM